jgi:hypothetical protein
VRYFFFFPFTLTPALINSQLDSKEQTNLENLDESSDRCFKTFVAINGINYSVLFAFSRFAKTIKIKEIFLKKDL